jgi:ribosome-associated protein
VIDREQVRKEIEISFIHASGPGGQNVNKVATAVKLRFDIRNTLAIDEETRERLVKLAGKKVSAEGILIIEAKRYRSQEKNRVDAEARLFALIDKASLPPVTRKPTKPTVSSKVERLEKKKQRGQTKKRRKPPVDWD